MFIRRDTYWSQTTLGTNKQFYRHKLNAIRGGQLPDFIVAGVQKGGSSSLFKYLLEHPRVLSPIKKEVHYFDMMHHRPLDWYRGFFPRCREQEMTFEATPGYYFWPHIPKAMKQMNPDLKLILSLRDPVTRVLSHYDMMRRRGIEQEPDIKRAIDRDSVATAEDLERHTNDRNFRSRNLEKFAYLARSQYDVALRRIYAEFAPNQVLIIMAQDLFTDTQACMNKVFEFLGLPQSDLYDLSGRNISPERADNEDAEAFIRERLEPSITALERDYGIVFPAAA